jgi:hypothetical protein
MTASTLKKLLTGTYDPTRAKAESSRRKANRLFSFLGQRVGGNDVARSFDRDPAQRVPTPIARNFDFDQSADHEEIKW